MSQSHAPHAFLEQAAIIDGEVSLAQLVVVHTVEALDWAIAHDPAVLLLVGTLVGVFFGCVVGEAADVAANIFGQALTLLHHMGEDMAAGTLLEGDEFTREAHD